MWVLTIFIGGFALQAPEARYATEADCGAAVETAAHHALLEYVSKTGNMPARYGWLCKYEEPAGTPA